MDLPISFKLPLGIQTEVGIWLVNNGSIRDVAYDWVSGILTFESKEDATAFALVFGSIHRHETKVEKMIKDAESTN